MSYANAITLFQTMLTSYAPLFGAMAVVIVGYGALGLVVRSFVYGMRGH